MITDPWFYALAIPAVLIAGIAKSGFGGGFAALSTPLIAMTVPVPQAAAIMLPVLCVMLAATPTLDPENPAKEVALLQPVASPARATLNAAQLKPHLQTYFHGEKLASVPFLLSGAATGIAAVSPNSGVT